MFKETGWVPTHMNWSTRVGWLALGVVFALGVHAERAWSGEVTANVVALDQCFFWNRLGARQPQGMMYALQRDVVATATAGAIQSGDSLAGSDFSLGAPDGLAGNVQLRPNKRPRPLVLRVNAGDTLVVNFTNLLAPVPVDNEQPATRHASLHISGMQLMDANSIAVNVGENDLDVGVVAPGASATYRYYAEREGVYHIFSGAAMTGGDGNGGSLNAGLFGACHVEPTGSDWYRSQVTAQDMVDGRDTAKGVDGYTPAGHPILNYDAAGADGTPIFRISTGPIGTGEIVHSDLTAIIVPEGGTYLENPVYPDRDHPFREFTIIYHDELGARQAFGIFKDPAFKFTLHGVQDAFAINYGTGGIGAEIVANRLGVGPMWDCTECKYEEFFLTSWAVGDPAMIVDVPANAAACDTPAAMTFADDLAIQPGAKAAEAFYPDDPSNVYHSYLRDHVKFRLLHGGSKEHHIHHLHAHQWVHSPDSSSSAYLDSQAFGPGAAYTLEMVYNGSGNKNGTVGDSIFHCHFYPHFAMGMWAMWRVHDVFEDGSRRLPDGEIPQGTPIPGLVPLPGLVMAPMPGADVAIVPVDKNGDGVEDSSRIEVTAFPNQELGNPGYPFFIPGEAGHRPPHPPKDFAVDAQGDPIDGGLPRHYMVSDPGNHAVAVQTPLDFSKDIEVAAAVEVPEDGTALEQVAMAAHAQRYHDSYLTDGTAQTGNDGFIYNGLPAAPGAPYAEPCMEEDYSSGSRGNYRYAGLKDGKPSRTYKAANLQIDAVINKVGWHFPQMRVITLWDDVAATYDGTRAPEPFFFRAESGECIEYWHTNLVPNVYELDDFQVRTPTDILGQHIHLVKFDVTSSDGSGNGWNYEDGTFSPEEVRERIHAINAAGGLDGTRMLTAKPHPFFGSGPGLGHDGKPVFSGAQTTIQRWYADPVLNLDTRDRTLRTVFTHDHYGPSTHQQAGLYAGLLVEPAGSDWRDPATGDYLGERVATSPGWGGDMASTPDGGPTSWRVNVETADPADSYREFMFEFADFQLAYKAGGSVVNLAAGADGPFGPVVPFATEKDAAGEIIPRAHGGNLGFADPPNSVNPPGRHEVPLNPADPLGTILVVRPDVNNPCPNGDPPPCAEAISVDDPGTYSVNYRTEPIPLRVATDQGPNPQQAAGLAGDLSHVFRSNVQRNILALNANPNAIGPYAGIPGNASEGALDGDPYTPLLRTYENDRVQIRTLVGAHEEGHNFAIHGLKWLYEPSWGNSGYRASQMMGISEHFEFNAPTDAVQDGQGFTDYVYQNGAAVDDLWNGMWGILRVHDGSEGILPDLLPLPSNPDGKAPPKQGAGGKKNPNPDGFAGPCPATAPVRKFKVRAVLARDVLAGITPNPQNPAEGTLVYNSRTQNGGPLHDPTAILYFRQDQGREKGDIDSQGNLRGSPPIEPLVLRANAGDCIHLDLVNGLPATEPAPDLPGFNKMPMIVDHFNANQVRPSSHVGYHAQLCAFQPNNPSAGVDGTGINVGYNEVATAAPGETVSYKWYAGDVRYDEAEQKWVATPMEFGAVNLIPSDPIKHSNKGGVAALIIEPEGSTWETDADSHASATVTKADGSTFREFVTVFQNDVNLRFGSSVVLPTATDTGVPTNIGFAAGDAIPNLAREEDPEDSAQKAVNYGTEPMWFRMGYSPEAPLTFTRGEDFHKVLHNSQVGDADPETPVFIAEAGEQVRFRVLEPAGHARNHVFAVFGHVWQELPYQGNSSWYGENRWDGDGDGVADAPDGKWMTLFEGARMGHGPSNHFDAVLQNGAGGIGPTTGDYLWRDMASFQFDGGIWGIFRVTPEGSPQ